MYLFGVSIASDGGEEQEGGVQWMSLEILEDFRNRFVQCLVSEFSLFQLPSVLKI